MNRYWINFAKHGHPNEGEPSAGHSSEVQPGEAQSSDSQPSEAQPNNTEQPHWPAWSETRKLMVFDRQPRIESDVRNQKLKALAQGLGLSLD